MRVTFIATTYARLDSIPVVDGQVIAIVDRLGYYYDHNRTRYEVSGGGGGSVVEFIQTLTEGTKIGEIVVDDVRTDVFAPTPPERLSQLINDAGFVVDENYVHTDNNFTANEKNKLEGIEDNAQRNVQSDWNQTDESADDYIRNKPEIVSDTSRGIYYGISETPGSDPDKIVVLDTASAAAFPTTPFPGVMIAVKFSETNTSHAPKLTVGTVPATYITNYLDSGTVSGPAGGIAGRWSLYVYTGGRWAYLCDSSSAIHAYFGVCETAPGLLEKSARTLLYSEGQLSNNSWFPKVAGSIVSIYFNNPVPANATLNVDQTGAAPIWKGSSTPIASNIINQGETATFLYDGSHYVFIAKDSAIGQSGSSVTWTQLQEGGSKIATIDVDGNATDVYAPNPTQVSVNPIVTQGAQIASINIDGESTTLFAPTGGVGGSTVEWTQDVTSGTKIGSIEIDGASTDVYAPRPTVVAVTPVSSSGTRIADIRVDTLTESIYAPDPTEVAVTQKLTSGAEVGTITVDGTATKLYAPSPTGLTSKIYYGTCDTSSNVSAKLVILDEGSKTSFPTGTPQDGTMLCVKFTNTNTATNVQLNIQGYTSASDYIVYWDNGAQASGWGYSWMAGTAGCWSTYVHISNRWVYLGDSGSSTQLYHGVCDTATATAAKEVTLQYRNPDNPDASYDVSHFIKKPYVVVSVYFYYDVPAGATLNVTNSGAHPIYDGLSAISADKIHAGDTATFLFDGYYYRLLSNSNASGGGGGGSEVTWTQTLDTGTKIASIDIDGASTDVYAPKPTSVTATATLTQGTEIGSINVDGSTTTFYSPESLLTERSIFYGTCTTAGDLSNKAVTLDPSSALIFPSVRATGLLLCVKYSYTNTYPTPSITVTDHVTTRKIVSSSSSAVKSSRNAGGMANGWTLYMYAGDVWVYIADSSLGFKTYYGICTGSTATLTATTQIYYHIQTGDYTGSTVFTLKDDSTVSIKFGSNVVANATLNIDSTGAFPIWWRGIAISSGVILAGDTATFLFDGLHYQLISIDRVGSTVAISPSIVSGTQIGTVTVDGVSTTLYAPSVPVDPTSNALVLPINPIEIPTTVGSMWIETE